jgi:hypothetical protein
VGKQVLSPSSMLIHKLYIKKVISRSTKTTREATFLANNLFLHREKNQPLTAAVPNAKVEKYRQILQNNLSR